MNGGVCCHYYCVNNPFISFMAVWFVSQVTNTCGNEVLSKNVVTEKRQVDFESCPVSSSSSCMNTD